ncbi:MAG TPA: BrnA antitoxin family protein [Pyrinomonadaceae bacterium]|nr:BrnA antitoxin family protein [Pyrinomonadaceae bacterium]
MKTESKTDWARVDAMTDDEIDTSDIPELDEEFFAQAELRMPKDKHSILLSIDEETYEWFEDQGPDFRSRMNAALKIYADAHR